MNKKKWIMILVIVAVISFFLGRDTVSISGLAKSETPYSITYWDLNGRYHSMVVNKEDMENVMSNPDYYSKKAHFIIK